MNRERNQGMSRESGWTDEPGRGRRRNRRGVYLCRYFQRFGTRTADLIFPSSLYCICCGKMIDQTRTYSLCDHCMTHMRWNIEEPKVKNGLATLKCCDYGIYARSIIFSLKYNGRTWIAEQIGRIMADRLADAGLVSDPARTVFVPVPLHPAKERRRGFSQTALITEYLSAFTGIRKAEGALRRVKETRPMRGLGPAERRRNIEGSLRMPDAYRGFAKGKKIIIVDDFYTTGSTGEECARALQGASPDSLLLFAFAAR